jgi:hypothetical protein
VLEQIHECSVQRQRAARGLLVGVSAMVAVALEPGRAEACGASPSPNYTISDVSPGAGSTAVARDAGIIVSAVPSFASAGPTVFAEVELVDADTDQGVPLRPITWYALGGSEETLALHPSLPLEGQHSYRIEAKPIDLSGDGSEGPVFVTSFMTSSELLEPLTLSGDLQLSLRGDDVDIIECGPCGSDCAACLPSLASHDIQELARDDSPLPLSTDEDIASEQVRQAAAASGDKDRVLSCAFGAGQSIDSPAWLMLLLSSSLLRILSRRRRCDG